MPYSSETFENLIDGALSLIKPKEFLDIGAGAGKYGELGKLCKSHRSA